MIYQKATYYPNSYDIKSFKEYYNDKLILHEQYDIFGNKTLIETPEKWILFEYSKEGISLYQLDSEGYYSERIFNDDGTTYLWVGRVNEKLQDILPNGTLVNVPQSIKPTCSIKFI